MSAEDIERLIPHRPPMRLLDEIVSRDDATIVCRKTFSDQEYFFQGHYPETPIVPGVMLCEAAMQAGAVLLAGMVDPADGKVPVATRINNVRFKQVLRPGATVDIIVQLTERLADAFFLTGKITHDGRIAARLDFACTVVGIGDP